MMIIRKFLAKVFHILEMNYWEITYKRYREQYSIAKSFRFNGRNISFYGEGVIEIGENTYIGEYSSLQAGKGNSITIGANCAISHFVAVYTESYSANCVLKNDMSTVKRGNVVIGNGCWIGMRVFIKEGVKIGNNCVIGANTLVTSDIPDNSLAIGVPAKVIRVFDKNNQKINYNVT